MHDKLEQLALPKNQTLLHILTFISCDYRWYSIEEISQEISLVDRSVQRYVQLLYDLVAEYNQKEPGEFVLQMKKNKGVQLKVTPSVNVQRLKLFVYEQDPTIQLLTHLLFGTYSSVDEYCRKMEITPYSVRQALNQIDHFMKPVGITVSNRDFRLIGDESQIRMMGYSVSWILFQSEDWPKVFQPVNSFKLLSVMNELLKTLHLELSSTQKQRLAYMMAINVLRIRRGEFVTYKDEWDSYVPEGNGFELNQVVESMYQHFYIYSQEEVRFFTLNLLMKSSLYKVPHFKQMILETHRRTQSPILPLTELVLSEFDATICPIEPGEYDRLYLYLFRKHLAASVYKQADIDYSGHSILPYIQSDFHHTYARLVQFIQELWRRSEHPLFLEERYLVQLYFMMAPIPNFTLKFEPPLKLNLRTDLTDVHDMRLKESIIAQCSDYFHLQFVDGAYGQDPDVILTNLTVTNQKTPTVFIDYPLNRQHIRELKQAFLAVKRVPTIM